MPCVADADIIFCSCGFYREFGSPQQISTGFASWRHYCTDIAHRRPTKFCTLFGRLLGWYTNFTAWYSEWNCGTFAEGATNIRHAARWKIQDAEIRQKFAICAPSHKFIGLYSQVKHISTTGKSCQTAISPSYGLTIWWISAHLMADIGWLVWGTPAKWVSRLGFVTAPTSVNGGQPNFAQCLAVSWLVHYIYIFWGSCPLTEFCQVQYSLCVQAYIGSVTARYSRNVRQPNFAAFNRGRHLYSAGRPSCWASAHILVTIILLSLNK